MFRSTYRWIKWFFRSDEFGQDLAFFRNVSIFSSFTPRQLGRIIQATQKRQYISGETLFKEGQIGKAVFIIRSGQVELTRTPTGSKEPRHLGKLGAGQVFGEMALLEQRPRTASAKVIEDGEIYLLYTATLDALMKSHPVIGYKLMRNMAMMLSALLRKTNHEMDQKEKK